MSASHGILAEYDIAQVKRAARELFKDGTLTFVDFAVSWSGDAAIEKNFLRELQQMYEVFCQKQHDYGRGNISKFGEKGVLVRVSDKIERLINLDRKNATAANEPKADTWGDIATYGVIGLMCHKGTWLA